MSAVDLIVTLPHVFAVLVLIGWFVHARRGRATDPGGGSDHSGGAEDLPRDPQPPLIGGRRDDLARSA